MVAKNTIEILKTIKKKIQKFDGKPQVEDHEIEHIEPFEVHAEMQAKQSTVAAPQNPMPKFEDDLGLSDLDDETAFKQKADTGQNFVARNQMQQVPAAAAQVEETHNEWDEEKLAKYDEEIERLLAKEHKPQVVEETAPAIPTPTKPQDDIERELAALDEEIRLTKQNKVVAVPQQLQQNAVTSDQHDDLEDDLLLDDDLELNEDHHEEAVEQQAETHENEEEYEEDFSLDDSDHDVSATPLTTQQPALNQGGAVQNLNEEIILEEDENHEEFDFDELEHEADEIAAKQVENIVLPQEEYHESEADEFDRELEMAESSITKIPLSQLRSHLENSSTQAPEEKHEVDLEFEKEFYSDSATSTAPKQYDRTESNLHGTDDLREVARAAQYQIPQAQPIAKQGGLLNDATILQTTESLKKLLDAKNMIGGISDFTKDPALRQVAINMLEPRLDRWLNENLPGIVEDIVRDEIKKIMPR